MAWCCQATWANVDPDLCHHMASLGHNELTKATVLAIGPSGPNFFTMESMGKTFQAYTIENIAFQVSVILFRAQLE